MNKLLIGILGGIIAITTSHYSNAPYTNVQEKHEYWCEDIESCEECKEEEEKILREEQELYERNKELEEKYKVEVVEEEVVEEEENIVEKYEKIREEENNIYTNDYDIDDMKHCVSIHGSRCRCYKIDVINLGK